MDSSHCKVKMEIDLLKDMKTIRDNADPKSPDKHSKLLYVPDMAVDTSNAEKPPNISEKRCLENDLRRRFLGLGYAPIPKRKHNVLPLEAKLELIKKLENGESINSLAKQYNVGRATVSDIKNKKESILSFTSKLQNGDELKTRKTVRKVPGKSRSDKLKVEENKSPSSDMQTAIPNNTTESGKRKHNVLSIEAKIEIIQRLEKGETGRSLAPLYNVGRTTISDIKNKKDSILMFASKLKSEDGLRKRKTMRKANDTCLEDAVYMWYIQKLSQGEAVTGPLLCEKALELNSKLRGPSGFKASHGWLKSFRSRHGLKHIQSDQDSTYVDFSEVQNFLQSYLNSLQQEGYSLDDIYAADETEIDWQTMPEHSIVYQRLSAGREEPPDRVIVLVCANLSWSHALPLLMIGKTKKKKCFGKISSLPLTYKWQKNGWMDSEIFMEWYASDFISRVKTEREMTGKSGKVLLLLDCAKYHPDSDMLNVVDGNFQVMVFPQNVTVYSHPMDKHVVSKLKRMLKKQVLHKFLLAADDEDSLIAIGEKLSLKECCYMLSDAWITLTQKIMQDNWKKMLEISKVPTEVIGHKAEEKDLKEFAELFKALPGFSKCTLENAREWLKIDSRDPAYHILNEDEIVTSVKKFHFVKECDVSDLDDDDVAEGESYPTDTEAFNAFDVAMEWCELQKECSSEQLILLKRLKDLAAKKIWGSCVKSYTELDSI